MNENDYPIKSYYITVDGERILQSDLVPIENVRRSGVELGKKLFDSLLTLPPSITVAMSRIDSASIFHFRRMASRINRLWHEMLFVLASRFRPKWLHYYCHGRRGKTRRKYRKLLIRLARKVFSHVRS